MRPFLSLSHFTVIEADPLTLVDVAAEAGFDGIGLRVVRPTGAAEIVDVAGDAALRRDIRRRLDATGIQILDIDAIFLVPDTDVSSLRPALDAGAELGARHVSVSGFDADHARMAANLGRLNDEIEARGLRMVFEFLPYTHIRTLKEAHGILREIGAANAGILVDALHLDRSGGTPADIASYDPALFPYVHVCDAPVASPPADGLRAEARSDRFYPGEGGLPLRDFVMAFPPGTPAEIEVPSARRASMPFAERARLAAETSRALFGTIDEAECRIGARKR
jgi:sugar phosphate isomerase/epimerase